MVDKPTLIIITGGSGTGKTSVEQLLTKDPNIIKIVSTTTRPKREGEEHGKDYYFISKEEFETELNKGKFLENVVYDGNHYGIHGKVIDKILGTEKKHGVIIVDMNGYKQLRKYCVEKGYLYSAFWFQAGYTENMVEHMRKRKTSDAEIIRRLSIADREEEMASEEGLSFVLIPENQLERGVKRIKESIWWIKW